jgi:hypothetical protein
MLKRWGSQADVVLTPDRTPEDSVREAIRVCLRDVASRVELRGEDGKYLYCIPEIMKIGVKRDGKGDRLLLFCYERLEFTDAETVGLDLDTFPGFADSELTVPGVDVPLPDSRRLVQGDWSKSENDQASDGLSTSEGSK